MNHQDADKLAQEAWDAVGDIPYVATTIDHKLRLCTIVNSIDEQLAKESGRPSTGSAGLEDFEGEVIRRLTALAPVAKELVPEENEAAADDKKVATKKPIAKKK